MGDFDSYRDINLYGRGEGLTSNCTSTTTMVSRPLLPLPLMEMYPPNLPQTLFFTLSFLGGGRQGRRKKNTYYFGMWVIPSCVLL